MNAGGSKHPPKIVHKKKHVKKKTKAKTKKKEDDDLVKGYLFPIHFVDDTKAAFNLLDLMIGTPVMLVDRAKFVQHIFEFVELDTSYRDLYAKLEIIDLDELMILWDPMQKYGASYNVVISGVKIESLKMIYGLESKIKKEHIEEELKLEPDGPTNLCRWVSLGSSLDVDSMIVTEHRKLTKIRLQTDIKNFNSRYNWTWSHDICCSYESEGRRPKEEHRLKKFRDVSLQVSVESCNVTCQAGFTSKKNAAIQTCYQTLTEEEIDVHLRHPDLPKFLRSVLPEFEKIMKENAQWDIFSDDGKFCQTKEEKILDI